MQTRGGTLNHHVQGHSTWMYDDDNAVAGTTALSCRCPSEAAPAFANLPQSKPAFCDCEERD